ncbi:MAG: ferredoxin [Pirellulaceae bacterium]
MPLVKFIKEKKEIEVPEGAVLRAEAAKAGINLNCGVNGYGANFNKVMNCHGLGLCGTCRVLITKGIENTNKLTARERLKFKTPIPTPIPDPIPCLAYIGHEDTMRLACMTRVFGDIEVESGPEVNLFGENFFS